ncbi:MAG: FG-GAP repeat domain-containing protein [Verrucomicrobiaceae bacterium]
MLRGIVFYLVTVGGLAWGDQGQREEELASKAGEVWKELSHLWDVGEAKEDFKVHVAEDCVGELDGPEDEEEVLKGGIAVREMVASGEKVAGVDEFLGALQKWPESWGEGAVSTSKFKVIGVRVAGDVLETTQLVSVLVEGKDRTEYNGRWESKWKVAGEELRLLGAEAVSGQVVRVQGARIFVERTSGLLPEGAGDDGELMEENFYWRERVPAEFEPDQFGETGISVADVNGDGLEDVYLCQIAGLRNRLWLRTEEGALVEAEGSGLEIRDNTGAALFVDLDGDRDRDVVLTTAAGVVFLSNDGEGHFTEKFRLKSLPHGYGMGASDFDRDGDPDVFVCQYHGTVGEDGEPARGAFPHPYPVYDARNGGRNVLLRNEGEWVFVDATEEAGLEAGNNRLSFACLWEDFDNDGWQDLFVVNDFGPNNYFRNVGEGRFEDHSDAPGVKDGGFGMGMTAADFDQDGRFDLHISNMYSGAGNRIARQDWFQAGKDQSVRETMLAMARGNTMLRNLGGTTFEDCSTASGIAMGRWSWASMAVDLNNDSREDLLVANGFVTGKDPDDL